MWINYINFIFQPLEKVEPNLPLKKVEPNLPLKKVEPNLQQFFEKW